MGYWWDRVVLPVRRVWLGVAARFGVRQTGLWRLRQEVSTCEYEDVHVMWEMLSRTSTAAAGMGAPPPARRHSRFRQPRPWTKSICLCAGF
ncbi:uncharacterized protein LOC102712511 [Oryza brachyantha]|uniref:Uncharacterized protein n=1 Tax=Oryza brachyantha TaxID=4533 RepID=J3LL72_ORYBR|nr:uncharacterized protein LOC102712511 [Oryza brachyantha]